MTLANPLMKSKHSVETAAQTSLPILIEVSVKVLFQLGLQPSHNRPAKYLRVDSAHFA